MKTLTSDHKNVAAVYWQRKTLEGKKRWHYLSASRLQCTVSMRSIC